MEFCLSLILALQVQMDHASLRAVWTGSGSEAVSQTFSQLKTYLFLTAHSASVR